MIFNSLDFILFLPIVFFLYWFLQNRLRSQNFFVVIASYVFYGWWDWRFLILIAITSLSSFVCGVIMERAEKVTERKACNFFNIVLNLGILATYKYYDFFAENLAALIKSICGYELDWITLNLILPVGISFYTFQALSYSIDVYKRKITATKDPIDFFAYISFFPQLVAGPIERATNLLPQFQKSRTFDYGKAVDGLRQMLWGFFKKIVVADNCAILVDATWAHYQEQSGLTLIIAAVLFSFQLYCDFSGYSDIAIGTARLFGINLKKNFDFPYFSRNISEFWRKWHISLMTWFRDYVYIPLGGSRCSKAKLIRNIFIVFLLSGLWHKPNWTYIAWGGYHAALISILVLLNVKTKYEHTVAYNRVLPTLKETAMMLITFILVVISRVFSRAETIGQAFDFIRCSYKNIAVQAPLFFFPQESLPHSVPFVIVIGLTVLIVIEWLQRNKEHALDIGGGHFYEQTMGKVVHILLHPNYDLFICQR